MGIVKVVMCLRENCTTTAFKCRCNKNVGVFRLSKNDDFKVFESVLEIGRLAGRSGVY